MLNPSAGNLLALFIPLPYNLGVNMINFIFRKIFPKKYGVYIRKTLLHKVFERDLVRNFFHKIFLHFVFSVFVFCVYGSVAVAFPNQHKGTISGITGSPVAVAVSPNDRWVFVGANPVSGAGVINFIDTIEWKVAASLSLSGSAQVVALAVSKDGTNLYVTDSAGYLTQIPLAPLSTYNLGSTLSLTSKRCLVDDTGDALGGVAVGPIPGENSTSANQYVLVVVPDGGTTPEVRIYKQTEITALTSEVCPTPYSVQTEGLPSAVAAAPQPSVSDSWLAHILVDDHSFWKDAHAVLPFGSPSTVSQWLSIGTTYQLSDIALNSTGNRAFIWARDGTDELLLADTGSSSIDWARWKQTTMYSSERSIALTVWGEGAEETVIASAYDASTGNSELKFYSGADIETAPSTLSLSGYEATDVASSSPADGFVYVGASESGAGRALVITENPWITNLTYSPSPNDGYYDTVVNFNTDIGGTLWVVRGTDVSMSSGVVLLTKYVTAGTNSFNLSPSLLLEGNNQIVLFIIDANGNRGRIGFPLIKDSVPAPPRIDVDFGDGVLYVTIHTLPDEDISHYIVYYSSDYSAMASDPPAASSLIVADFQPNSTVKVTISGLTNGVTYYVRARAVDETAHEGALSEIKSVVVQRTLSLSEVKGESGCAVSRDGKYRNTELIPLFLMIFGSLAVKRIIRRGHKRK